MRFHKPMSDILHKCSPLNRHPSIPRPSSRSDDAIQQPTLPDECLAPSGPSLHRFLEYTVRFDGQQPTTSRHCSGIELDNKSLDIHMDRSSKGPSV
mmetsp:Transcript_42687/g.51834  ORF Transcript_42687/g.51834 Transcript_42687/m.51834 type:complete len:96 (+) Transcript_42687:378-665(+)